MNLLRATLRLLRRVLRLIGGRGEGLCEQACAPHASQRPKLLGYVGGATLLRGSR